MPLFECCTEISTNTARGCFPGSDSFLYIVFRQTQVLVLTRRCIYGRKVSFFAICFNQCMPNWAIFFLSILCRLNPSILHPTLWLAIHRFLTTRNLSEAFREYERMITGVLDVFHAVIQVHMVLFYQFSNDCTLRDKYCVFAFSKTISSKCVCAHRITSTLSWKQP